MKKIISTIFIANTLIGCTPWPPQGHGGAAEIMYHQNDHSAEQVRLLKAENSLSELRAEGAGDHMPAALEIAMVQWVRAIRATEGGFTLSAKGDLDELENMLFDMQAVMKVKKLTAARPVALQEKVRMP